MVNLIGTFLAVGLALLFVFGLVLPSLRKRNAAQFQPAWRDYLRTHVDFYADLGEADRARFEAAVAAFLGSQVITGPRGVAVGDETKLLVASAAVILTFGIPDFEYPRLRDIVVYPTSFDEQYDIDAHANIAGMVHAQGPILFSERDLKLGFKKEHDGYNVGLHEFAHVLDFGGDAHADGVPAIMPWRNLRPWARLVGAETIKIKKHQSVMREYGATNEAEFFAVATEFFFERPRTLKEKHPSLYAILAETYRQDPAAKSDRA